MSAKLRIEPGFWRDLGTGPLSVMTLSEEVTFFVGDTAPSINIEGESLFKIYQTRLFQAPTHVWARSKRKLEIIIVHQESATSVLAPEDGAMNFSSSKNSGLIAAIGA
jgi:hypothetical protein